MRLRRASYATRRWIQARRLRRVTHRLFVGPFAALEERLAGLEADLAHDLGELLERLGAGAGDQRRSPQDEHALDEVELGRVARGLVVLRHRKAAIGDEGEEGGVGASRHASQRSGVRLKMVR